MGEEQTDREALTTIDGAGSVSTSGQDPKGKAALITAVLAALAFLGEVGKWLFPGIDLLRVPAFALILFLVLVSASIGSIILIIVVWLDIRRYEKSSDTTEDAKLFRATLPYRIASLILTVALILTVWLFVYYPQTPVFVALIPPQPTPGDSTPTSTPTSTVIPTLTVTPTPTTPPTMTAVHPQMSAVTVVTPSATADASPHASLISLMFESNEWNPRFVDLRTSGSEGIPVMVDRKLRLFDFWVSFSDYVAGYEARVIVSWDRERNDVLAWTDSKPYGKEPTRFGPLVLFDSDIPTEVTWNLESDWIAETLYVSVVTYRIGDTKAVNASVYPILLSDAGAAWYLDPPYSVFATISYAIDDGPEEFLDLGSAPVHGINAGPGDVLRIDNISFRTNMGTTLHVKAYITDAIDQSSYMKRSLPTVMQGAGTGQIASGVEPMEWKIPDNYTHLIMTLERIEGEVADMLVIPLSGQQGAEGLFRNGDGVLWPFDRVPYEDFEQPTAIQDWRPYTGTQLLITATNQFSGKSSLAVGITQDSSPGTLLFWDRPFKAKLIVGQLYQPKQDRSRLNWLQVCLDVTGRCFPIHGVEDEWYPIHIDLSEVCVERSDANECLQTADESQVEYPGLYFQGGLNSTASEPYTFFLDGIQLYAPD